MRVFQLRLNFILNFSRFKNVIIVFGFRLSVIVFVDILHVSWNRFDTVGIK